MYISLHVKYKFFCQISVKLEFFILIFEQSTSIKIHEKSVQLEPSCSIQKDRQKDNDKANSRFFVILWMCLKNLLFMYPMTCWFTQLSARMYVTYIAQHLNSIYSAMQHTNFIHPPSKAHHTRYGRNNSHFWRRHCSGCGGDTVMGVVSLVSCGLAIFRRCHGLVR